MALFPVTSRVCISLVFVCLTACVTSPEEKTLPQPLAEVVSAPAAPDPPSVAADTTESEVIVLTGEPDSTTRVLDAPPTDLFQKIRNGFLLDDPARSSIAVQVDWFSRNPEYLERTFGRSELYMYHIVDEVERRGMPMEIALLPVVESAFEPYAYSSASASGLWQFIPDTGTRYGLRRNWWYDGRRDVVESTRAALDYLQFLNDEFNGDWLLAIAGYNCGEACVARAVRENQALGRPTDFWSLRLPAETRAYVPKLLAMKRLVEDPESYGLAFSSIPNEPYFVRVEVGSQIDLKLAAELSGIRPEELFELNPAFHRWATPPRGPHHLLLPLDAAETFRENTQDLTPDELMRVVHHRVQPGDTLAKIAQRYGSQTLTIRMLNNLGNGPLTVGTDLRVPSPGSTLLPIKVQRAAARVDGVVRTKPRRPTIHIVRRGDSIWAVAQRNNVDPQTLMRMNNMQPGDALETGQRLVLPNKKKYTTTTRTLTYTIRRGDTLSRIAKLYQVKVSQIAAWNGIKTNTKLTPGKKLKIKITRRR